MEILGTETIFNQDSADIDFRIEGNGDANLFKINAGTDQVFINGNAQDLASNGLNVGGDGNDFTMGISNQDTSSGISFMKFTDGSGDQCGLITGDAGNNSLSLSSGSDYRLKENINYSVVTSNTRSKQSNDSDCIFADINKLKKLNNHE